LRRMLLSKANLWLGFECSPLRSVPWSCSSFFRLAGSKTADHLHASPLLCYSEVNETGARQAQPMSNGSFWCLHDSGHESICSQWRELSSRHLIGYWLTYPM
jgi:hypothetical protein